MNAALPPRDEEEAQDASENVVTTPYVKRRPRNLLVVLAVMLIFLFAAIGGIIAAVTTKHEDPSSIQIPVYTAKSLADDKTANPPASSEPQPAMMEQQTPAPEASPVVDENPGEVTPVEPVQTEETPMDLNQSTSVPEADEKQAPGPQSFLRPHDLAPQTIVQLPHHEIIAKAAAIKPAALRPGQKAQIVIVIDDMGLNIRNSHRAVALPAPVTLAYLPYADNLATQTKQASASGHELIVHMPMEPDNVKSNNPGPNALLTSLPVEENVARLKKNLDKFDGYIGLNNHMGSRMTANPAMMRPLLQAVKERGLWFLDSRTIGNSVAGKIAGQLGIPYAERDVFLDNVASVAAVMTQLRQTEQVARKKGYAIAIGHPHDATLAALQAWLPEARERGFQIVPLSAIISQRFPSVQMHRYAKWKKEVSMHAAAENSTTKNN